MLFPINQIDVAEADLGIRSGDGADVLLDLDFCIKGVN
jgi:hypothetical protein